MTLPIHPNLIASSKNINPIQQQKPPSPRKQSKTTPWNKQNKIKNYYQHKRTHTHTHKILPFCVDLLNSKGRYFMDTSYIGLSVPRSLTVYIKSDLGFRYLLSSAAGGGFSNDSWTVYWSMSRAEYH